MLIDGKEISRKIKDDLKDIVSGLDKKPGLAVILVGEDPASQVYVRNKEKACETIGYYSEKHKLPAETTEEEVLSLIRRLNDDPNIHGMICQLPLPKHIDPDKVIQTIDPSKDVDGFHAVNMGKLLVGQDTIVPCTPKGIMELIRSTGIEISGKLAVVVGRSNIVGKPIAVLLLQENATVTICHSRTKDLADQVRQADIVVAAVGRPKFITADMVKEGAVVIDVGINRTEDGKLVGDVDFDGLEDKASFITPVPGGVGPMTIAMLMQNTYECYKRLEGLE